MNTKARSASLATVVQKMPELWPTPVVGDATGGRTSKGKDRPDEGGLRLEAMKRETFPTPQQSDSARGPDRKKATREGSGGDDLVTHVAKENWPTPRAADHRGCGPLGSASHEHRLDRGVLDATVQDKEQRSGGLSPRWVEWLMGWPPEWTNPNCSLIHPTPDTWAHEPPGVSRLAPKSMPASERRSRLSILGNGWVPQAAAVVFARIISAQQGAKHHARQRRAKQAAFVDSAALEEAAQVVV